ncbi:MFS transporter [Parerythrobacter jejuensis]|uniref:MFS transporter n=1 Tax=Parerythrobacter jejuensis TaxID=795812 RepID=A0A845ARD5_9SPHN|nr:MFS transporter [Parerythrobacter jejuensis]MXP31455.1 MFS transporter [Parerythrobacter jejuensis]
MADADPTQTGLSTLAAAKPPRPISRERLVLLFAVMLVTAAGNTAMQSVMPSIGTALGVQDVWISLAYSWSALLWVLCAPIWAKRSDQRGRKAMMALGMVGFIFSMALCGLVLWFGLLGLLSGLWTLIMFAVCRSLYGAFGSAAPPAVQAYVASRTPRSERTQALSVLASSFGLGTVIGPALAPLLIFPGVGLTGPFIAFSAIGVVTLIALRFRLPNDEPQFAARGKTFDAPFGSAAGRHARDTDDHDDDLESGEMQAYPIAEPPDLKWTDKRLLPWMTAGLLGGHAQAMILGISGFLVLDRLGLRDTPEAGAGPVGIVLMVGAVATLLAQWGLIPTLQMGPRASTLWGMALAVIGVVLFGVAQDLHAIALGFAVASLGFGLYRPGFTAGASLAVTRPEQGQVSGKVASINGASYIYAPALGVLLYGYSEWLGFAVIIAFCVAVFVLGYRSLQSDEFLTRDRT